MKTENSKTIFWVSTITLTVVLNVLASVIMESLGHALGHRNWGNHGGAVGFPCLVISVGIITAVFRRTGLLERERVIETLHREPESGPVVFSDPVELRTPRSMWMMLGITMDVLAIAIFLMVSFLSAVPGTKPLGYGGSFFFALFSLGPWYGYATHAGLIARVDANGVRSDSARPKSSARWSDIASCEITAVPQPWGQVMRYTFRDAADKTLMRLMLAEGAEQNRFLAAIRECFN